MMNENLEDLFGKMITMLKDNIRKLLDTPLWGHTFNIRFHQNKYSR